MGETKGTGPEAATYAAALRAAVHDFTTQGGTQREIATATHVAPATLSRYLSGERTAPTSFVAALDSFLAQRGRPLEAAARARLDELCGLAHQASGSPAVQLSHLKEELARVQAEKKIGKAELASLKKHADELAAELRQALDEARRSEQGHAALQKHIAGQDKNLEHAQLYTRQLEAELTSLQAQVVLIQREVKVLRRQNKRLIEESTTNTRSGTGEKSAVSGASTQATGTRGKDSRSSGKASRNGKQGKKHRQDPGSPRPANEPRQETLRAEKTSGTDPGTPVFSVSWTGNEDPRTFSRSGDKLPGYIYFGLSLIPFGFAAFIPGKDVPVLFLTVGGLFVALGFVGISMKLPYDPEATKIIEARTLRFDSTGLTASDPSGKQYLPWAAIKEISFHHAKRINGYAFLALHLQIRTEATTEAARVHRPAGWPLTQDLPEACRRPARTWTDEWIPVCLLGPLTGPEKTALQNTLTVYLKTPLKGIW